MTTICVRYNNYAEGSVHSNLVFSMQLAFSVKEFGAMDLDCLFIVSTRQYLQILQVVKLTDNLLQISNPDCPRAEFFSCFWINHPIIWVFFVRNALPYPSIEKSRPLDADTGEKHIVRNSSISIFLQEYH